MENIIYQNGWFLPGRHDAYADKNIALRAAYEELVKKGVKNLHYLPCDNLLGKDAEGTVDGTHPTDLGFMRMTETLEPVLKKLLK